MSEAGLDEFLRYLFWYFVLIRAGGKKSLPPNFLSQKTPAFLINLFLRRGEIADLSARDARIDAAAIKGRTAFYTGDKLWLRPGFDRAVRDIFYESNKGSFITQIDRVFRRFECPGIITKWERDGEVILDEDGVVPAGIVNRSVSDTVVQGPFGLFFGESKPRLRWRGLLLSAWSDGSVLIHRAPRERAEWMAAMENGDRWGHLTAGDSIVPFLDDKKTVLRKDSTALLYDSLAPIRALKQLVERAEPLSPTIFDAYLDPVFSDLRRIHEDYLQMFETTRAELKNFAARHRDWLKISGVESPIPYDEDDAAEETESIALLAMKEALGLAPDHAVITATAMRELRTIATELRLRRTTLEPLRVQLQHVLLLLTQRDLPSEERAFMEAVIEYFPLGALRLQMTKTRVVDLHDPYGADQITNGMRLVARMDDFLAILNSPFAAPPPDPADAVPDDFPSAKDLRPVEADDWVITISIDELPKTWSALQKHVEAILRHHRQHWRRVCTAYETVRSVALKSSPEKATASPS